MKIAKIIIAITSFIISIGLLDDATRGIGYPPDPTMTFAAGTAAFFISAASIWGLCSKSKNGGIVTAILYIGAVAACVVAAWDFAVYASLAFAAFFLAWCLKIPEETNQEARDRDT
ncbi:MAG: hypothetical protein FWE19_04155 [Oscillospiraceae bacterium]|nr:hypothetical protein [Oscillospiraceae bacterium]